MDVTSYDGTLKILNNRREKLKEKTTANALKKKKNYSLNLRS